ncbi:MAG: DUF882 domain-containing protein [Methyloprofundus sp.]|nr:DUF882 domain-containing protein [Methyloprofundus sp.]
MSKENTRREFLRCALGVSAAIVLPQTSHAFSQPQLAFKDLKLHNLHTEEKISLSYFEQGHYIPKALQDINYLLRDHRTGDVCVMDPKLIDLLFDLKNVLAVADKPLQIISGYRSAKTNAALHKKSKGVATKSLHMQGKAIDIRIEGVSADDIRAAAISLERGGVGYYPSSNFVHIDTGNVRSWG